MYIQYVTKKKNGFKTIVNLIRSKTYNINLSSRSIKFILLGNLKVDDKKMYIMLSTID